MRRVGGLFDEVASLEGLWAAWRTFRRGKRGRRTVAAFELDADRQLLRLHRALTSGGYAPGPYRLKLIREPKVRLISAAPVRDRVVHHAVHRVSSPRLDGSLIHHTYACLEGRGLHRALFAASQALPRHRFVMSLDVRRFFLSVDHGILQDLLRSRLKDRPLLALLDRLILSGDGLYHRPDIRAALQLPAGFPAPGQGLPIGNLTSQWLANHYLSPLDHFITRALQPGHYQRYMDDLLVFDRSPEALYAIAEEATAFAAQSLGLALSVKQPPQPCLRPLDYLGHRLTRDGEITVARQKLARARRRLRRLAQSAPPERVARVLASYQGWAARSRSNSSASLSVALASAPASTASARARFR
jgi:RNA-directed DNA polymerase